MSSKFTSVRLTIEGDHYEILVYPDPALNYRAGKNVDPTQVIAVDEVFTDSSRGLRASEEKMKKHFGTDDHAKAALEVLKRGELQLTQDQRKRLTEEKRKQVVNVIAKNYVDPRTRLPHPPVRIEQAMQDARVTIDPFKDVNEQTKEVLEKIRLDHPPEIREGQADGQGAGAVCGAGAGSREGFRRDT